MNIRLLKPLAVATSIFCAGCAATEKQDTLKPLQRGQSDGASWIDAKGQRYRSTKLARTPKYVWKGRGAAFLCNAVNDAATMKPIPTISGILAYAYGRMPRDIYDTVPTAKRLADKANRQGWARTQPAYLSYLMKLGNGRAAGAVNILNRLEQREGNCFREASQELLREIDVLQVKVREGRGSEVVDLRTGQRISLQAAIQQRVNAWELQRRWLTITANQYALIRRKLEVIQQQEKLKPKPPQIAPPATPANRTVRPLSRQIKPLTKVVPEAANPVIAKLRALCNSGLCVTLKTMTR